MRRHCQRLQGGGMDSMTLTEILTIVAIVIAPIMAVQVQKWLEVFREEKALDIQNAYGYACGRCFSGTRAGTQYD